MYVVRDIDRGGRPRDQSGNWKIANKDISLWSSFPGMVHGSKQEVLQEDSPNISFAVQQSFYRPIIFYGRQHAHFPGFPYPIRQQQEY